MRPLLKYTKTTDREMVRKDLAKCSGKPVDVVFRYESGLDIVVSGILEDNGTYNGFTLRGQDEQKPHVLRIDRQIRSLRYADYFTTPNGRIIGLRSPSPAITVEVHENGQFRLDGNNGQPPAGHNRIAKYLHQSVG